MGHFLWLLAAGLYLGLLCQVNAESHLSRSDIEKAVLKAKASVDSAYKYSRMESIKRVKRHTASPADILRCLKQPCGPTRSAVRAADYMDNAVALLKSSMHGRQKRSINATDLITEEALAIIAELTGCSARDRKPSCIPFLHAGDFRTASGVCNNGNNPRYGASNTPLARWLPCEYQDGLTLPQGWDPEQTVNGHIFPLVREVSNQILRTANSNIGSDPLFSNLLTIFAQFIDHDLTFTPHSPAIRSFSNGIDCDQSCERTEPCFPIDIPEDDPRFGNNSDKCLPFFRSAPACGSGNTGLFFGEATVRQQMNALTAFIDGGQVYGSDDAKASLLRDLSSDKGLLRVNMQHNDHGRELLPFLNTNVNMCATRAGITNDDNVEEVPCSLAGDVRVDENIALTSLHTLLMREHNRLARALAILNPGWSGERLYQEARKIIGGYLQVLVFRDFLPHIFGPDFFDNHLSTYPGYDEDVDPSISNVFATAAYRFAHLMVQPFVFRLDENYNNHNEFPSILLHTGFFAPWRIIFEGGVDPILRGLVGRRAKLNAEESRMPDELRERLFEFTSHLALDLASLNMQRGRDHGLPGYNKWRRFCGLSEPQNLSQLAAVLSNSDLAEELLGLYGTPDNIDVWLGGVIEPFVPGGRVGPLFACLIAKQFQSIREGDRLWWENDGVFTEGQRESLRTASLSRIICDNTGITEVPEEPFMFRPRPYTQCADIPAFDLSPWEDIHGGSIGVPGPPGPVGPPGEQGPPGPPGIVEKIAFAMQLGNDNKISHGVIIFIVNLYNDQHVYDTTSGYFTCETPGVYEFQFHCVITRGKADVNLLVNSNTIFKSFNSKDSGSITASGSTYIKLKKNDKVYLVLDNVNDKRQFTLSKASVFMGHLLFPY